MFRVQKTPDLKLLLDDLLTRSSKDIADHLGVSLATFVRWQKANQAPKAALLALFYETRWGYSVLETTAHNRAMYARREAEGLKAENANLRLRIARLERMGDFGAANAPYRAPALVTLEPVSLASAEA